MEILFVLVYYFSILVLISSIIVGIKNYYFLGDLRLMFYVLCLSFCQIFFTEFIVFTFVDKAPEFASIWSQNGFITVNIYSIIEFGFILNFLNSVWKNKKRSIIILLLFVLGIILYVLPLLTRDFTGFKDMKYFSLISGFIILNVTTLQLYKLLKINEDENIHQRSILIMCIGIFLTNTILWPTSIIQSLVKIDFKKFYKLLVIANSSGYLILYFFALISFYGKRE